MKSIFFQYLFLTILLCGCMGLWAQQPPNPKAFITVQLRDFEVPDNKLRVLLIPKYIFGSYENNQHTAIDAIGEKGTFHFDIPITDELAYFIVQAPGDSAANSTFQYLSDPALLEPGDSIQMDVTKGCNTRIPGLQYYLSFRGKGSLKLECLENMRKAALFQAGTGLLFDSAFHPNTLYWMDVKNNVTNAVLQQYRGLISPVSFDQLWVDATYLDEGIRMDEIRRRWTKAKEYPWQRERIMAYLDSMVKRPVVGSDISRSRSKYYAGAYIRQAIAQNLVTGQPFSYNVVYAQAKQEPPMVRDRILVELFGTYGPALDRRDSLLADARKLIKTPLYLSYLELFSKVQEGAKALDFSLKDATGKIVRLSDFNGKVVLMDFWFTGCGPCMQYYQHQLKAVHARFKDQDKVVFISISVDKSKEKWMRSIQSGQYTSSDAVNLYTNGLGDKHELVQLYNVVGYPSPVLIDQKGRVATLQRDKLMTKEKLINGITELLSSDKAQTNQPLKPASR